MQEQDTAVEARAFADRVKVHLVVRANRTGTPQWDATWRDSNKKSKMRRVGQAWLKGRPQLKNPYIDHAPGRTTENEPAIQEGWRERWEARGTTGKGSQAMRHAGAFDPNGAMSRARDLVFEHELELARERAARAQRDLESSPEFRAKLSAEATRSTRTFATVAHQWYSDASVASGWKPTTARDYLALLASPYDVPRRRAGRPQARLMTALGALPIVGIGSPEVRSLLNDIARSTTRRTANKHRTVLSMIFDFAVREKYVDTNPVATISPFKTSKNTDVIVLDMEQVEAVARQAGGDLGDIIRFAAYTGLRMGEIVALRWGDIRWRQRVVNVARSFSGGVEIVEPKSGKARTVPLAPQVAALLDQRSRSAPGHAQADLVFGNATGEFLNESTLRREYEKAREQVRATNPDLPQATFHQLRHTFGTQLAKNSVPLLDIKHWMGHSDIKTTMIYLQFVPQAEDADRIGRALSFTQVPEDSATPAGHQPKRT